MKAYKNHDKHSELKLFLSIIVSSEVIDYLIILLQKTLNDLRMLFP